MGIYSIRLPDVGEGVAEAELVEWKVKVGDTVLEDEIVGAVMTDKAAVEIPTSVTGKVTWLGGDIGDVIAVGAELLRIEIDGVGNTDSAEPSSSVEANANTPSEPAAPAPVMQEPPQAEPEPVAVPDGTVKPVPEAAVNRSAAANTASTTDGKPQAAPSVRKRAGDMGIDVR